jgi:transglutaminase-like putative cysteine protease
VTKWTQSKVLVLGATAVCCLLQVSHLPWLCATAVLVSLIVSAATRVPVLPRAAVAVMTVAAVSVGYLTGGETKDAGLAVVVLLACQKLFDLRVRRDVAVVLGLDLFLLAAALGGWNGWSGWVVAVAVMLLLLTAQVGVDLESSPVSVLVRARIAFRAVWIGLPIALALAVLLPMPGGSARNGAGQVGSGRATAGLSDSLTPGDIESLTESKEVAFLARFKGAAPSIDTLYWRAEVLSDFDGKKWYRAPANAHAEFQVTESPQRLRTLGAPVVYELIVEPTHRTGVPALAAVAEVEPGIAALRPRVMSDLLVRTREPVESTVAYRIVSFPSYISGDGVSSTEMRASLALPHGQSPRTVLLGQQLRASASSSAAVVSNALRYFREHGFVYTRRPGTMTGDQIDHFMFDRRAGFCEHYASAFAVLMRAAGVPARVVVGYHGGVAGDGPDGKYLAVFQSHAHAWVEVWLAGRGWVQLDPTGQAQEEAGNAITAFASMLWGGQSTHPAGLLVPAWLKHIEVSGTLVGSLAAGLLGLAAMGLVVLRQRVASVDQVRRIYQGFGRRLEKAGFGRELHEGPTAYAARLRAGLPVAQGQAAEDFLRAYAAVRYGRPDASNLTRRQLRVLAQRAAPLPWWDVLARF